MLSWFMRLRSSCGTYNSAGPAVWNSLHGTRCPNTSVLNLTFVFLGNCWRHIFLTQLLTYTDILVVIVCDSWNVQHVIGALQMHWMMTMMTPKLQTMTMNFYHVALSSASVRCTWTRKSVRGWEQRSMGDGDKIWLPWKATSHCVSADAAATGGRDGSRDRLFDCGRFFEVSPELSDMP